MHFHLTRIAAALAVVIAASCLDLQAAQAQVSAEAPPLQGHIMGGFSAPSGNASDYLDGGWILDGGLTFWPQGGPIGIRADVSYDYFYTNGQYGYYGPYYGANHGWADVSSLAAGVVFQPHQYGWARFYGLAQINGSDVRLRLRQYNYNCAGPYNCPYGAVYANDYGATKLGWNVGLGVDFPTYWGSSWFLEAQWRRVQTQQAFDYWPVTVGLRF